MLNQIPNAERVMVADPESEGQLTGLYEKLAKYPMAASVMPRQERCNLRCCKAF